MRRRPQPGQERLSSPLIYLITFEGSSLARNAPRSNQPIARLWLIVAALDRNLLNKIAPSQFCISDRAVTWDIVGRMPSDFIGVIDGRQSARRKIISNTRILLDPPIAPAVRQLV